MALQFVDNLVVDDAKLDANLVETLADSSFQPERTLDFVILLENIITGCAQLDEKNFDFKSCIRFFAQHRDQLEQMLIDGWKDQNFARIRRIVDFQRVSHDVSSVHVGTSGHGGTGTEIAVTAAWDQVFQGDIHKVLYENINAMKRDDYSTFVPIIQSSGTGKSRMVHELSRLVFTIPFNLRPNEDSKAYAYPPPDPMIRDCLVRSQPVNHIDAVTAFYYTFLGCTFEGVRLELETLLSDDKTPTYESLATRWCDHLRQNRTTLYKKIVAATFSATQHFHRAEGPVATVAMKHSLIMLKREVSLLVEKIHHSIQDSKAESTDIRVLLYFDEAHTLSVAAPANEHHKQLYDVLCSCLARIKEQPVFTVFLSTSSHLARLAPAGPGPSVTSRSARALLARPAFQAPITEVSFDCAPGLLVEPDTLRIQDVSKVEFMAQFGRPLFWTMIEGAKKCNTDIVSDIITIARMKLLCHDDISMNGGAAGSISNKAEIAVLDVRLMFDYEPRREAAVTLEADLVASHMRIAFSVPQTREYVRSGYPSEPILAEAAAQQMYVMRQRHPLNHILDIMAVSVKGGLLDRGERGELVGRYLLTAAYDRAVERENPGTVEQPPFYSKGCPVITFIEELFTDKHAQNILDAKPDNVESDTSFREAFKGATVRFTHFIKVADDTGMTTEAMCAAFIRGAAIIARNNQDTLDAMLPVLLWNKKLSEWVMTAIMVKFKCRIRAARPEAYEIDANTFRFFPLPPGKAAAGHIRPYITLVMELGVQPEVCGLARTPDVPTKKPKKDAGSFSSLPDAAVASEESLKTAGLTRHSRVDYPRYSIFAYGCSHTVYKVMKEGEKQMYTILLASRDMLAEHPRQNAKSLAAVRQMKPFFSRGMNSYHWYESGALALDRISDSALEKNPSKFDDEDLFGAVLTGSHDGEDSCLD